jgi:hypothetical protein
MPHLVEIATLIGAGLLVVAGINLRAAARRRGLRPAVPGGVRRDFFGDAADVPARLQAVAPAAAPARPAAAAEPNSTRAA